MNYISTTSNQALMAQALKSLTGKWGVAIGSWLVFFILTDFQMGWEWQEALEQTARGFLGEYGWLLLAGAAAIIFKDIVSQFAAGLTIWFSKDYTDRKSVV